jgi:hypothetical protein
MRRVAWYLPVQSELRDIRNLYSAIRICIEFVQALHYDTFTFKC